MRVTVFSKLSTARTEISTNGLKCVFVADKMANEWICEIVGKVGQTKLLHKELSWGNLMFKAV